MDVVAEKEHVLEHAYCFDNDKLMTVYLQHVKVFHLIFLGKKT